VRKSWTLNKMLTVPRETEEWKKMMLKTLHTILSYYCFMVMFIFNLCLWFATVDYILHIHVIMKPYYIVLHLLNKSAFIILLETVDSLRYFYIIASLYIIYWYRIWGGRISGFPRLLGGLWWQFLRLDCLLFCGLLCFSLILSYF